MLGNLIAFVREKRGLSKTALSEMTGINVGHLTHIEKGERNPSQGTLRDICKALDIPFQQMAYTYDKTLDEDQSRFGLIGAIPFNTVPLVQNIDDMIECPSSIPNAALAFVMQEDTMKSSCPKGTTVFLEFNTIPKHKELGLFRYNGKFIVRKIIFRKNKLLLKADNLLTRDILVDDIRDLTIVGKVHVPEK